MTTEQLVKAAANPKDAMLVIARALDRIEATLTVPPPDPWATEWSAEDIGRPGFVGVKITQDVDTTEVVIPPASPEKQAARRQFAEQSLQLEDNLGTGEDWLNAYAKGGPIWLYEGNRELFMTYGDHVRRAMVQDVIEDDPKYAGEMGRDVLKEACEEGPNLDLGSPTAIGDGMDKTRPRR